MKVKALENFTYYDDSPIQVYKGDVVDMSSDNAAFYISEGRVMKVGGGGITPTGTIIITENGTGIDVARYAFADVNVPTGSADANDVHFYDYDGTVVASYSAADFANLTAMPANPSHERLTAQGWNWSLSDAKEYVAEYGKLNIGQMYITASGDTEIDIELHEGRLSPILGICPDGTVEVDWGDGSETDTLTGTDLTVLVTEEHEYASEGSYTIKLKVTDGEFAFGSCYDSDNDYSVSGLLWGTKGGYAYNNSVKKIHPGSNVADIGDYAFSYCSSLSSVTIPEGVTTIGSYAFTSCYSLSSVTIPEGVTTIGSYAFTSCYSLSSVTIPEGVTTIGESAFNCCSSLSSVTIPEGVTTIGEGAFDCCYSLSSVTIPEGVTTIGSYAFTDCYSLSSVTIPEGVTSIGESAFTSCYSLSSVTIPEGVTTIGESAFTSCSSLGAFKFESLTPPTVLTMLTFGDLPTDCIIYVPTGSLSAYTSATNYPDPSVYTYVEY